MNSPIETLNRLPAPPEPSEADNQVMLRLIDSHTPEREVERQAALRAAIDPHRLRLHELGLLCLTSHESERETRALLS